MSIVLISTSTKFPGMWKPIYTDDDDDDEALRSWALIAARWFYLYNPLTSMDPECLAAIKGFDWWSPVSIFFSYKGLLKLFRYIYFFI